MPRVWRKLKRRVKLPELVRGLPLEEVERCDTGPCSPWPAADEYCGCVKGREDRRGVGRGDETERCRAFVSWLWEGSRACFYIFRLDSHRVRTWRTWPLSTLTPPRAPTGPSLRPSHPHLPTPPQARLGFSLKHNTHRAALHQTVREALACDVRPVGPHPAQLVSRHGPRAAVRPGARP